MTIRAVRADDAAAIATIYNHYVTDTIITFEEVIVSADEMARRISGIENRDLPWIVGEEQGQIVGFAYAAPFRKRIAYRYSVETTIYLDISQTGKGFGRQLYGALIEELRSLKLRVAIGSIALPNEGSVRLHESFGFVKTAHFSEIGFKFDRWVDVGYWQLLLDASGAERGDAQ